MIKILIIIGIIIGIIFQVNLVSSASPSEFLSELLIEGKNNNTAFYFLYERIVVGGYGGVAVSVVGPFRKLEKCESAANTIAKQRIPGVRLSSCWEGPVK